MFTKTFGLLPVVDRVGHFYGLYLSTSSGRYVDDPATREQMTRDCEAYRRCDAKYAAWGAYEF